MAGGFWVFMLIMDMLVPVTMICLGRRFLKRPPGNINALYGYRSARSMKNPETWAFAHRVCGRLWYAAGLALLPLSLFFMLMVAGRDAAGVGAAGGIVCIVQLLVLAASVFITESALKKAFDRNGRRK